MLSPGHSRSSSCSFLEGDGPDFLEIAINELCTDDEIDFVFSLRNEEIFGEDQVDANQSNVGVECESQNRLELKERPGSNKTQCKEDKSNNEEKSYKETKIHSIGEDERKPSLVKGELNSAGKGKVLAENLDKRKPVGAIARSKKGDTLPKLGSHSKKLEAVTKTAEIWKSRAFADGFSIGIDISPSGNEKPSACKGTRPSLRNLPRGKNDFSKNQKKIGLHDVVTNLYTRKKEYRLNSLDNRRNFRLAERSGAKWLKNTIRHDKRELPPIDFSSKRHYSTQWNPKQSISSNSDQHHFETPNKKDSELKSVLLKSIMQTLEKTQLGGKSRAELVKHSISSLEQTDNGRERFKKKAVPVVKSTLAFKHPCDKFI